MSARLADTLERCVPTILDEWAVRARGSELETINDAERAGDLGAVLQAMSAALQPYQSGSRAVDDFIEIAAGHGARRRAQGIREECLFEEYDFLGAALPHAMRRCQNGYLAPEDLLSLEGGLTTAILAGLRGFHRGEFERRGAWSETLARVMSETSEFTRRESDHPREPMREPLREPPPPHG